MSSQLTPFSYVILALVGEGGAAPHDLAESRRRAGAPYWAVSTRSIYSEPRRLARLGYLAASKHPGRTHERTVYTLTRSGKQALREWVRGPTRFPRVQAEAPVRLVAGYLATDAELLASLRALGEDIDNVLRGIDEAEAYARTLPHRERYLRLVHSFGRRLVQLQRDWLAEVELELGGERR